MPPGFGLALAIDAARARIIAAGFREVAFLRHRIACGRGGASDAARLAGLLAEMREDVAARAAFAAACRKLGR
jgi:hypothetical protein